MKRVIGVLLAALSGAAAQGQAGSGDSLRFTLDRTGAVAVHYSLELDGATRRGAYLGAPPAGSQTAAGEGTKADGAPGKPITVSEDVLRKAFAAVPLVKSNRCASHRKVAQTGTKTLRFVGNGAVFECTYNYSEDERVNTATTVFEGLAETMQYGDRLEAKLRFDRLGLDAEIDELQSALTEGRALEVGNIAPVLVSIENDERVMDRVRRKAAHLLQAAGLPTAPASEGTQASTGEGAGSAAGVSAR